MALNDQQVTVRFALPHEVVWDTSTTIEAPLYLDGAILTATGGSVSVRDQSNVEVLTGAVVVVGGIATFTIALLFTEGQVGQRIQVLWSVTHAGGTVAAENDGIVVRRELHPVIADADLYRRIKALDPTGTAPITTRADFQDLRDEAWAELVGRMIEDGVRASWVMSPSSTRRVHTLLTLALLFEDEASRLQPAYMDTARMYREQFEVAYAKMNAVLDGSGDGTPDDPNRRVGVAPSGVWMGSSVRRW